MRYTLTVPFVASKGRPRAGQGRVYTPKATRQAEEDIAKLWIAEHGGRIVFPAGVPIRMTVSVFIARPKRRPPPALTAAVHLPDLDNVCKLVDALSGIAFVNDMQITSLQARKFWAPDGPRTMITLEEDA